MKRFRIVILCVLLALLVAVLAGAGFVLMEQHRGEMQAAQIVAAPDTDAAPETTAPAQPAPETTAAPETTEAVPETTEAVPETSPEETYLVTHLTPLSERMIDLDKAMDEAAFEGRAVVTSSEYLNIRREPSSDSPVIGKIYRGCIANVLQKGEEYTKISSGSVTGWVSNKYVAFGRKARDFSVENGVYIAVVKADNLNMREAPDASSTILSTVNAGDEFIVDKILDGWVRISYTSAIDGYLSRDYVDVGLNLGKAVSVEEEKARLTAYQNKAEERQSIAESIEESSRVAASIEASIAQSKAESKAAASRAASLAAAATTKAPTTTTAPSLGGSSGGSGSSQTGDTSNVDDETLFAALIYREAGSNYRNCLAVAISIMNRVRSPRYPNTLRDVIYQKGQFSPIRAGTVDKEIASGKNIKEGSGPRRAARDAMNGETRLDGEEFPYPEFVADWLAEQNPQKYAPYVIIGDNAFYHLK
ncbi:MAG: SH3 domain-containing protein [Lachnospiraceae bacterium]|nr:SH3 domain-containing protein [Lachnospiraceae bacterium]